MANAELKNKVREEKRTEITFCKAMAQSRPCSTVENTDK